MGYERAGWYSYDQLDMKGRSADAIIPELQSIKVGDILPTFPGGGFEVRVVDDGHALAVYTDTAITNAQAEAFAQSQETVPLGLQASGSFMRTTPPDFAASWAFVLDPLPDGRTRLIERVRVWYGAGTAAVGGHRPGLRPRRLPDDPPADARDPRARRADGPDDRAGTRSSRRRRSSWPTRSARPDRRRSAHGRCLPDARPRHRGARRRRCSRLGG